MVEQLRRALIAGLLISIWQSSTAAQQTRWREVAHGILQDSRTQLLWTKSDNGADIDWNHAAGYCAGKGKVWRLPSIEELAAIFDADEAGTPCAEATCKLSSHFELTGSWFWSSTQVEKDATDGEELAWGLGMVNGVRTQSVRLLDYGSRALCVRNPASSGS